MSTRKNNVVIIAASIILIVCLSPRLWHCYIYNKFIVSNVERVGIADSNKIWEISTLNTISQKPVRIEINPSYSKNNFSLGYADFYIDINDVCEIKLIDKQIALIKCTNYSLGFLLPGESPDLTPDINKYLPATPQILPSDMFEAQVKAAYIGPKTVFQIFTMSAYEFSKYMTLCILKTMLSNNQNGTGVFKTDRIKGIVGFGEVRLPNKIVVDVFSSDSSIWQSITINANSPEKAKEIMVSLLSSYRYSIEKPPDDSELEQLIFKALSPYRQFCVDDFNDTSD